MKNKEAIIEAAQHLKEGKLILFPSDTVWGLSCDATNQAAVERLIQLKKKSTSKGLIVLVNSDRMINQCIKDVPEVAWDMIDFSEQALTLILEKGQFVAPDVIHDDGSLGIRKVKTGAINDLLFKFNRPIVSTSANFSGLPTPTSFSAIDEQLKNTVDYIYPFDQKEKNASESKIVRIKGNGEVEILRK